MKLSDLQNGEEGIIVKVKGYGSFRKRIIEMGFVKGKKITVIKNAPLKDPIEYKILDYKVSLRRSEAALIDVITKEEAKKLEKTHFQGTIDDEKLKVSAFEKRKTINIALVGNPNCGKTTLFNYASGAREHVGNYSGVTVDSKHGFFEHNGYHFNIYDLPGTYSISAYTPEEIFVRNHIINEVPDIVVNVIDSSNIERNLYLTTQLIDMDIKVVVALNMYDELQRKGDQFNYDKFGKMLGIPFIPTISSKGQGITELFERIIDVYEDRDPIVRHIHVNYGETIENSIKKIRTKFRADGDLKNQMSTRYLTIKGLEKDKEVLAFLKNKSNNTELLEEIEKQTKKIEKEKLEDSETVITDARYGFIAGALKGNYKESPEIRRRRTDSIDNVITHRLFGFPIFIFFMWMMFQTTFKFGSYPMNWIDQGVAFLSEYLSALMPDGSLKDLIIDGIIGGVGGVIIFLPNILILFFFISFMEDTGYMARAAFIMDKIMHKMGLHGKSFIPLIMGFGCNVPAVMATRTIEDKNDRLLTMLINPFMSCSARLPVYILIIGAFFPSNAGTVLFGIYITGILLAVVMAKIFKKYLFTNNQVPFVMELPPYRLPTLRNTIKHMWTKAAQYLKKMGGIILIASIIIWFLGYFPRQTEKSSQFDQQITHLEKFKTSNLNLTDIQVVNQKIDSLLLFKRSDQQANSYIGKLGKSVEPVIKPLGFDWKMGVSLITGIAAKEIVVSTMAVLYQSHEDEDGQEHLTERIRNEVKADGSKMYNSATALAFLIFTLVYFPCVAVVVAIRKESGSWKWAAFTVFYTTSLAWILALIINQVGQFFI